MAAYEQKVEPPDKKWQYLLFAAEPYETIAFKVTTTFFWAIVIHNVASSSISMRCIQTDEKIQ